MGTTVTQNYVSDLSQLFQYAASLFPSIAGVTPANDYDQLVFHYDDGTCQGLVFQSSTGPNDSPTTVQNQVAVTQTPSGHTATLREAQAATQQVQPVPIDASTLPPSELGWSGTITQWENWMGSVIDNTYQFVCQAVVTGTRVVQKVAMAGTIFILLREGQYTTALETAFAWVSMWGSNTPGGTGNPSLGTAPSGPVQISAGSAAVDTVGMTRALWNIATREPVVSMNHGQTVVSVQQGVIR